VDNGPSRQLDAAAAGAAELLDVEDLSDELDLSDEPDDPEESEDPDDPEESDAPEPPDGIELFPDSRLSVR
jgi:hypothetical protein